MNSRLLTPSLWDLQTPGLLLEHSADATAVDDLAMDELDLPPPPTFSPPSKF